MPKIVLATGNQGKVTELSKMLADAQIDLVAQSELGVTEAAETGTTFVENAIIKARNAAQQTGLPAIADDSGLAVDALQGAPGIYSARYAGSNATDKDNVEKLLAALADTTENQRTARFICVLVYLRHAHDPCPGICQASWQGQVSQTRRGENGFGYDPVFYLPDLDLTAAQLTPKIKNTLSHRAQALSQLAQQLETEFA